MSVMQRRGVCVEGEREGGREGEREGGREGEWKLEGSMYRKRLPV